jgi:hypothetical protein
MQLCERFSTKGRIQQKQIDEQNADVLETEPLLKGIKQAAIRCVRDRLLVDI